MAGETVITVVGNLVDDVELRFTPGGAAVAKFRVASVPRTFNKETNAWEDAKDGLFLTCSVWRQAAENAAETLQRGMRVIVQGRLKQRSYEDREGVKRTVYELDVDEVGPSLKSATAKVTKVTSSGSGSGGQGQGQGREAFQRARQEQGAVSAEDPWAANTPGTSGGAPAGGGWGGGSQGGGYSDEAPF
ncbi:single-stranded DNA-binding protein [Streptomyces sp. ME02-6979.5a]|uniref:single-stranded DNA-binding protein n=1 Tax=Streptomyces sp. ME02-6979.5a TaxID=462925 RepID=UPI0029A01BC4|nr:single-stranded DNA-binding protein [Streptomyces sp. ME02-6979.5a]MDX3343450.1 single-stranded DNA-binding protein [Streptomyces sp. ME02-6979.5a]